MNKKAEKILAEMTADQQKEARKFHSEFMSLSPDEQQKTLEAMRSLAPSRM